MNAKIRKPEVLRSRRSSRLVKHRRQRWKRKRQKLLDRVGAILTAPFKVVFWPAKLLNLFYFSGVQTPRRRSRSRRRRFKQVIANWAAAPGRLVGRILYRHRSELLVYFVPAVLATAFVVFVGLRLTVFDRQIRHRYDQGARRALLTGDLQLAHTYFQRLNESSPLPDNQILQWAAVLEAAGEKDQAGALLADLAPDQGAGFPLAHTVRALNLAKQVDWQAAIRFRAPGDDKDWVRPPDQQQIFAQIEQLKRHLDFAGQDDPRIDLAWVTYWLSQRDLDHACLHIDRLKNNFQLCQHTVRLIDQAIDCGILERAHEQKLLAAKGALTDHVQQTMQRQLRHEPLNHQVRIQLAATLTTQSDYVSAQRVLLQGIQLQAEPRLRRALSDVFLIQAKNPGQRFSEIDGNPFQAHIMYLKLAIDADPSYLVPYIELTQLMHGETIDPNAMAIEPDRANDLKAATEAFLWSISSDRPAAIDHLCLASIYSLKQPNQAQHHLNQAWTVDPNIGKIAHRLALALVFFSGHGHVDWSAKLTERALLHHPHDFELLLSAGRISVEQGKPEQAIERLIRALEGAAFAEDVHEALQIAYENLGDLDSSSRHAALAQSKRALRVTREFLAE